MEPDQHEPADVPPSHRDDLSAQLGNKFGVIDNDQGSLISGMGPQVVK